MLVLSRQRDETIMIGDTIEVTVVDIRGDKVRLGINAPREVSVHRKEVYDAIRRENRVASQVKSGDKNPQGGGVYPLPQSVPSLPLHVIGRSGILGMLNSHPEDLRGAAEELEIDIVDLLEVIKKMGIRTSYA